MDGCFTMNNPYQADPDKMFTYLKAFMEGANMKESQRALAYVRKKHKGQTRKDGLPYIVHPLRMACYAASLGIKNDNTMCTILLHDVCEDCGIPYRELPFCEQVQDSVRHVTVTQFATDRSKDETKRRYYSELIYSPDACITKGLDKYDNLTDMVFTLSNDAIGKNVAETDVLLLPVLREARNEYPELSNILYTIRTNLRSVNGILMFVCHEKYEKWKAIFEGMEA